MYSPWIELNMQNSKFASSTLFRSTLARLREWGGWRTRLFFKFQSSLKLPRPLLHEMLLCSPKNIFVLVTIFVSIYIFLLGYGGGGGHKGYGGGGGGGYGGWSYYLKASHFFFCFETHARQAILFTFWANSAFSHAPNLTRCLDFRCFAQHFMFCCESSIFCFCFNLRFFLPTAWNACSGGYGKGHGGGHGGEWQLFFCHTSERRCTAR